MFLKRMAYVSIRLIMLDPTARPALIAQGRKGGWS